MVTSSTIEAAVRTSHAHLLGIDPKTNKQPTLISRAVHSIGGFNGPFAGQKEYALDLIVIGITAHRHISDVVPFTDSLKVVLPPRNTLSIVQFYIANSLAGETEGTQGSIVANRPRYEFTATYSPNKLALYCNGELLARA